MRQEAGKNNIPWHLVYKGLISGLDDTQWNLNSFVDDIKPRSRWYARIMDVVHSDLNRVEEQTDNIHEVQPRQMESLAGAQE